MLAGGLWVSIGQGSDTRRLSVATALLAVVWMFLDYPWGLLAFEAIAALYGLLTIPYRM